MPALHNHLKTEFNRENRNTNFSVESLSIWLFDKLDNISFLSSSILDDILDNSECYAFSVVKSSHFLITVRECYIQTVPLATIG